MRRYWNEEPTEEELAADRCGNCKFFEGDRDGKHYDDGHCLRMPPTVVGGSRTQEHTYKPDAIVSTSETVLAETRVMRWCGEHRRVNS